MWDLSDPVSGIIDKKARNLEKRKVRSLGGRERKGRSEGVGGSHTHTHKHTHTQTHTHTHTQNKLMALKETVDTGTQLDKDQKEAVMRLDEVTIQLELVKDLQKQFAAVTVEVCVCVCVCV